GGLQQNFFYGVTVGFLKLGVVVVRGPKPQSNFPPPPPYLSTLTRSIHRLIYKHSLNLSLAVAFRFLAASVFRAPSFASRS
ncbi:MAG: hypothetical protein LBK73_04220, partial [Treponema sp.]|nr:hypothetical protein [Treponema sp.]